MDKQQWKPLPVDPTPEMLSAAAFAVSGITTGKWSDMILAAYRAMFERAPSPSTTGERETVQCNCPGGIKPPPMHAPNCPVRSRHAGLIDPYDGGTWVAPSLGIDAPEQQPVLTDDFRNGIRTAADHLLYIAANSDSDSWAGHLNAYAADILELSPDDANEWKAINKAFREGYEAGKRAHPAAQQGDGNG